VFLRKETHRLNRHILSCITRHHKNASPRLQTNSRPLTDAKIRSLIGTMIGERHTSAVRMYCDRTSRETVDLQTGAFKVADTEESRVFKISASFWEDGDPGLVECRIPTKNLSREPGEQGIFFHLLSF
jgi:hypothetical protein